MLTLPFHRRHLRRSVWVMLLAWLLTLSAGVVNACQIQPHGLRAPAAVAPRHDASAERGGYHTRTLPDDGLSQHHGSTTQAAKAGCLKFCDDESSTLANGKTAHAELPGLFMVAHIAWRSAAPSAAIATIATWRSAERPAPHGPPLVIRFLRLTI